jgi:aspartyl-tRNA(Asn)/glutamyl-tRNA(Gln) amidotransferase subunit A
MYLEDAMTVPASMAGLPAISVPAGKTAEGLPVGAQLIGRAQSDQLLLSIAKSCEEEA